MLSVRVELRRGAPGCVEKLILDVERRESPLQFSQLRQVVDDDVRLIRIEREIVLVISLGWVKRLQRRDFSDDRAAIRMRRLQLGDVRFGYALLLVVGEKNGRSVLGARVRTLPVQFRRIVCDGENTFSSCP